MFTKYSTIFLMVVIQQFSTCYSKVPVTVEYLENGDSKEQNASFRELLKIYCYQGQPKNIIHVWKSVILQIDHSTDNYKQFEGIDPQSIQNQYEEQQNNYLTFQLFSIKHKSIKFNPFNTSCIGIESKAKYSVHLNVIRIDFWKVLLLVIGISLFLTAGKLSRNTSFHYICGVLFGICASFLILIYFFSKIFPKKPFMYGVLGCGWTVVIYVLQLLWENLSLVLIGYKSYVIWYLVVASIISFILCYRWGPIENQRTMNIIQWCLQFLSLISIFYSSDYKEAAMGQIIILLISHNLPKKWVAVPKAYWKKKFPPKVRLLSNDEYYEQGVRETTKALDELRKYCSSPDCNQWKTALQIKDVKRFASFMEGNSHLSDDEILEYETSIQGDLTDDDNDNSYTDEEEYDE